MHHWTPSMKAEFQSRPQLPPKAKRPNLGTTLLTTVGHVFSTWTELNHILPSFFLSGGRCVPHRRSIPEGAGAERFTLDGDMSSWE